MILPVDRDGRALPRQTWIDFCAVFTSVLRRDSPQEPTKDITAPLRPITLRRPSQRLNHQILGENSRTLRNHAKFSLSVLKTRKRKEVIWTCVPQKFVRISLYTCTLSLSRQLHIWTRGSHPAVHVSPSGASLTWAPLLTLQVFRLSYLCMTQLSA